MLPCVLSLRPFLLARARLFPLAPADGAMIGGRSELRSSTTRRSRLAEVIESGEVKGLGLSEAVESSACIATPVGGLGRYGEDC